MRVEVILPELGAAPARLSVWFADPGDQVYEGDRLVEVLVAGATFDVPAPATGRLVERRAWPDDPVDSGHVLGLVEVDEETET
jgi:pyruvate/2-oxoglutarate dehydrogenase complex dihydrolipoamide acyltransferase (E2) component